MRNRRLQCLAAATTAAALVGLAAVHGAPQFRVARPGYRYEFPRDHFAHPDFQTEWWYYTGNLRARDGHRLGFELTFFRQAIDRVAAKDHRAASPGGEQRTSVWDAEDVYLAHFVVSDLDGRAFVHEERVNRSGPGLAGIDAQAGVIWNGNWSARIDGDVHSLEGVTARFRVALTLASRKPPVVHGVGGVSQKAEGEGQASHYVSLTRLAASGSVEIDGRRYEVEGSAWMDHEFFTNQLGRNQRGWDWLGLQVDDGSELMVYRLRRDDGSVDPFSSGTLIAKDGTATHLRAGDFAMTPAGESWSSPATKTSYPIAWRVTVPSRALDVSIRTRLPSQELVSRSGFTPTYWEGAVTASGTRGSAPMTGVGYLEMTGYDKAVVLGSKK